MARTVTGEAALPTHARDAAFIEHLYAEAMLHKEHRHKHVLRKLLLTASLFGLGGLNISTGSDAFLFFVPFVALAHDLYIFAEDYKVKRVGLFIKHLHEEGHEAISALEFEWEDDWLGTRDYREKWAYRASLVYSCLVDLFAFVQLIRPYWFEGELLDRQLFVAWSAIVALSTICVFNYAQSLRKAVVKMTLRGSGS